MIKKIALFFLLSLKPMIAQQIIHNRSYTPENSTFVFDIDDVILRKNEPISSILWKHKFILLKGLVNPFLLWKTISLWYHGAPGEEYVTQLENRSPELANILKEILRNKELIPETVEIIQELKLRGYRLHIASNMGANDFAFYKEKFPEVFGLFDIVKVVSFKQGSTVKKPSPLYFEDFLQQCETHGENTKTKLFIDDKKVNIEASSSAGLVGIHFTSAQHLRQKLNDLHILV